MFDTTQSIILWHRQNGTTTEIAQALLRRYRHRRYSQVVDSPIPVNYAHWYFADSAGITAPLPGDEIHVPDGTVWTILEINLSPLTRIWQAVCETFASAQPTETVEHLRQEMLLASLPARTGALTTTLESEVSQRLTFYLPDPIAAEPGDRLRRSDGSTWTITRIDLPQYRARWTAVMTAAHRARNVS